MKGKKFAEVFASLVKTVAIASVSESSDWYNYQTKEPEGLRKIYLLNFLDEKSILRMLGKFLLHTPIY